MLRHGRLLLATAALAVGFLLAPATASAAGLIAAYEQYVTGQGFEIRIVNAATGAQISVPAGVNTPDDELHPALSADGRYLVFTRMKLQPKLNGDIVPPTLRTLQWVDRETGTITQLNSGGIGPVFTSKTATSSALTWGIVPIEPPPGQTFGTAEGQVAVAQTTGLGTVPPGQGTVIRASVPRTNLDVPHAASIVGLFTENVFTVGGCQPCADARTGRYLSLAYHNQITGALELGQARLSLFGLQGGMSGQPGPLRVLTFGDNGNPASHPVPRSGDGYVALDRATGEDADIHSITYPGETQTTVAPAPITTTDPERMPAWSPDGLKLAFVRHTSGQRKLGIFDATPGIQTVVNTPVAIGAEAPSPQTRQFQNVFGGMSIATGPPSTGPVVICNSTCLAQLARGTTGSPITLTPRVAVRTSIGIFVVRVTGTRRLLGRRAPRLRVVGRVPLGTAKRGRNRLRWNGRVNGKKLRRGTYLLTYRTLKGKRITNTSGSIRFRIAKGGKIRQVRSEPLRTPKR